MCKVMWSSYCACAIHGEEKSGTDPGVMGKKASCIFTTSTPIVATHSLPVL